MAKIMVPFAETGPGYHVFVPPTALVMTFSAVLIITNTANFKTRHHGSKRAASVRKFDRRS
jgi:hypothetical protein